MYSVPHGGEPTPSPTPATTQEALVPEDLGHGGGACVASHLGTSRAGCFLNG